MKGFTLIELLTVVVIVGVLASIALPQYQKSVEKSRAAEAMAIGQSIIDSQNRALDINPDGSVNTRVDLDIALSGGEWNNESEYETENFTYSLLEEGVTVQRRSGAYDYTLNFFNNNSNAIERTCQGDTSFCNGLRSSGFRSI